jgi:hypothetical protein
MAVALSIGNSPTLVYYACWIEGCTSPSIVRHVAFLLRNFATSSTSNRACGNGVGRHVKSQLELG